VDNGEQTLRFTIIDTGIGIAPEYLEMIFEPSSRWVRPAQNQGAGLGWQ